MNSVDCKSSDSTSNLDINLRRALGQCVMGRHLQMGAFRRLLSPHYDEFGGAVEVVEKWAFYRITSQTDRSLNFRVLSSATTLSQIGTSKSVLSVPVIQELQQSGWVATMQSSVDLTVLLDILKESSF